VVRFYCLFNLNPLSREKEGAMYATSSRNHKVLVLGAGYVSAPVVDYLTSYADTAVTVGTDIPSRIAVSVVSAWA